jgi:hypothetical protein
MKVVIISESEIKIVAENEADVVFLEFFLTKKPRGIMPSGRKDYLKLLMSDVDILPSLLNETIKLRKRMETDNFSEAVKSKLPEDLPELEAMENEFEEPHLSEIQDMIEEPPGAFIVTNDEDLNLDDLPEFETVNDEDIVE